MYRNGITSHCILSLMPKRPYRYFSFLLSKELEAALRETARKEERSMAWIVKKAMEEYMVKRGILQKPAGR